MTAKMLALTFWAALTGTPVNATRCCWGGRRAAWWGAALAAAHPEEFVTALVARTLANMGTEIFW